MQSSFFECPVCYHHYDLQEHLPRMLSCGHSLCEACLKSILAFGPYKCPLDNKQFAYNVLDSFPPNYVVRNMLEETKSGQYCQEHSEKINFACITDKRIMCASCVLLGHKEHEVKSITEIKSMNHTMKNQFDKDIKTIDEYLKEGLEMLQIKKITLIDEVDARFAELVEVLNTRKQQLGLQIKCLFTEESNRLKKVIKNWENIKKNANNSIENYQKDMFMFFENDWIKKVSKGPRMIFDKEAYFEKMDANIVEQFKEFDENILSLNQMVEELSISSQYFHDELDTVFTECSLPKKVYFIIKHKKIEMDIVPSKLKLVTKPSSKDPLRQLSPKTFRLSYQTQRSKWI